MWKQYIRLTVVFALLLAFGPTFVQPRAASAAPPPATRFVTPGGVLAGPCDALNPCGSIAFAVGVAIAGETISVDPGTYSESGIVINKDIYIVGVDRATTIIDAGGVDRHFDIVAPAGTVWIESLTLENGSTPVDTGGAIRLQSGRMKLVNVKLANNLALAGGAISHESDGKLWIVNSLLRENQATSIGGAVSCVDCGEIEIDGSEFRRNIAGSNGGAIYMSYPAHVALTPPASDISGTLFYRNNADNGGAIYNLVRDLDIRFSAVTENEADNGDGGGVFTQADLTRFSRTTFARNTATVNGGAAYLGSGELRMINNTVSGNSALVGGGVSSALNTTLSIHNNTFYGNSGTFSGGAINSASSTFVLENSILTASVGDDCSFGTAPTGGNNLIDGPTCGAGMSLGQVTNLDTNLNFNGWQFRNHLPLAGSNAIDNGAGCLNAAGNPLSQDQRGISRPQDGDGDGIAVCDIGAVEVQ